MKEELDKLLCKRYPKIFRDKLAPMNKTCMYWDLSCGNGWFWLIDNLCNDIQSHIDLVNENVQKYGKTKGNYYFEMKEIPQLVAVQVKEKLGSLRFYCSGGDEYTSALVSFAESLSNSICETCGSTENAGSTSGWIHTICKKCFDASSEEWKQAHEWSKIENKYDRQLEIES